MPAKPNTQNYLEQFNKASNQIHKHMENQIYNIYICTHCSEPMKQNWIQDSLTLTPICNCEGTYIPLTDRDNQIPK